MNSETEGLVDKSGSYNQINAVSEETSVTEQNQHKAGNVQCKFNFDLVDRSIAVEASNTATTMGMIDPSPSISNHMSNTIDVRDSCDGSAAGAQQTSEASVAPGKEELMGNKRNNTVQLKFALRECSTCKEFK